MNRLLSTSSSSAPGRVQFNGPGRVQFRAPGCSHFSTDPPNWDIHHFLSTPLWSRPGLTIFGASCSGNMKTGRNEDGMALVFRDKPDGPVRVTVMDGVGGQANSKVGVTESLKAICASPRIITRALADFVYSPGVAAMGNSTISDTWLTQQPDGSYVLSIDFEGDSGVIVVDFTTQAITYSFPDNIPGKSVQTPEVISLLRRLGPEITEDEDEQIRDLIFKAYSSSFSSQAIADSEFDTLEVLLDSLIEFKTEEIDGVQVDSQKPIPKDIYIEALRTWCLHSTGSHGVSHCLPEPIHLKREGAIEGEISQFDFFVSGDRVILPSGFKGVIINSSDGFLDNHRREFLAAQLEYFKTTQEDSEENMRGASAAGAPLTNSACSNLIQDLVRDSRQCSLKFNASNALVYYENLGKALGAESPFSRTFTSGDFFWELISEARSEQTTSPMLRSLIEYCCKRFPRHFTGIELPINAPDSKTTSLVALLNRVVEIETQLDTMRFLMPNEPDVVLAMNAAHFFQDCIILQLHTNNADFDVRDWLRGADLSDAGYYKGDDDITFAAMFLT